MQGNGFFEKVIGADTGGLYRGVDGAVPGHHHHRHGKQAAAGPLLEQGNAIGVRHPDVEQHHIGTRVLAARARFSGVLRKLDFVTFIGKNLRQQLADADFVVYNQYVLHDRLPSLLKNCTV